MTGGSPPGDSILRSVLKVILPTEAETNLLRAILLSGDQGRDAWQDWRRQVGSPLAAFEHMQPAQKGLVPMVHVAAVRNSIDVEPNVASFLRASYFREELRGNAYRRILGETLMTVGAIGRPFAVLRGCAISDTVYEAPEARHSHGINLLVRDVDLRPIADRLKLTGFTPAQNQQRSRRSPVQLSWTNTAGLPLELHTQLLDVPYHAAPMSEVWSRTRPLPGYTRNTSMLAPEDALINVCGNAAHSATRASLRWACDAWYLIVRQPALDWTLIVDTAEAMNLGAQLNVIIRYLAKALDAPVPEETLASLNTLAENAGKVASEIAVLGALSGAHARMLRMIVAAPDWQARFSLLRCLLIPSPASMREIGYASEPWLLPYQYLRRPVASAARGAMEISRKLGR